MSVAEFRAKSKRLDLTRNPPTRVRKSLESFFPDIIVEAGTEYRKITKDAIKGVHDAMQERVLGQEDCKREIALSLYRLHSIDSSHPVVIMLYGPSGVGKTESAKCLSEALGGGLTRIQVSMMQTTEAYDYIFGAEHSKGSFARNLLCRESNVALLDEFDNMRVMKTKIERAIFGHLTDKLLGLTKKS